MKLNLENLNEQQKKAVRTTEGAVLVLSGAGTGKTSVLTARIAYILEMGLAHPWQIIALTFTNKAAAEMKHRIGNSASAFNADDIWCGTFHSLCLRILRRYHDLLGLQKNFSIYDETDQRIVLKSVIENLGLDAKEYDASNWIDIISGYKMSGPNKQPIGINKKILDAYNMQLSDMHAMDFDDIILKTLELFDKNPDILEKYQKQFKYVMVDEFQDTNHAQFQFIDKIAAGYNNICCVGDDDQSIYSWRGAEIENILNFDKKYSNVTIIRLTINYRSTGNILGAANSVIQNNLGRLGKDLVPHNPDNMGEVVCVYTTPTDWAEASFISTSIKRGTSVAKYSDFAILIRSASLSRNFENEFIKTGIPYKMSGGPKIYERSEIKDLIAYMKLLINRDDNIAFRRAISKPRRGFGDMAIKKLLDLGKSCMESCSIAKLSVKQKTAADEFLKLFDINWQEMTPFDIAEYLMKESGYIKFLKSSKKPEDANKLDNLIGFMDTIKKSDDLEEFLNQISLHETENDNMDVSDKVNIMTMHAAKGLEFDTVFLPAWEENIFPNEKAIEAGDLEEERRLAYVSITRAKKLCVITNSASRSLFGKNVSNPPSRFISEIDTKFLTKTNNTEYQTRAVEKSWDVPKKIKTKIITDKLVGKQVDHIDMGGGVVIEDNGATLIVAFKNFGIKSVMRDFINVV